MQQMGRINNKRKENNVGAYTRFLDKEVPWKSWNFQHLQISECFEMKYKHAGKLTGKITFYESSCIFFTTNSLLKVTVYA